MILPSTLWWQQLDINHTSNSHQTPHSLHSQTSYEVSVVRIWEKIDCVIMALHCMYVLLIDSVKFHWNLFQGESLISKLWFSLLMHIYITELNICITWARIIRTIHHHFLVDWWSSPGTKTTTCVYTLVTIIIWWSSNTQILSISMHGSFKCCNNTVIFPQNTWDGHPIIHLWAREMVYILCLQIQIYISSICHCQCFMQCHVILW